MYRSSRQKINKATDILNDTTEQQLELIDIIKISSVAQSCLTLCDPMDCSTPGCPVLYQLPEPAQTHVRRVSDAIQPSHPLLSPSPPAFSLSQHQALFPTKLKAFYILVADLVRTSLHGNSL